MASAAPRQVGRIGRQVDRSQLVQTHHVVGDHDLGRQRGQSGLRLAECLMGLVERRRVVGPGRVTGGFISHVRYPTDDN